MAFHPQDSEEAITQINVVPLVDIMLVLLVIFMLTANFISTPSVPVSLPKALTSNPTAPESQAVVLTAQGTLYFQDRAVERGKFVDVLQQAVARKPDLRIVLSADASVTHGKVVEVLDLIRMAGVSKVALGVTKP